MELNNFTVQANDNYTFFIVKYLNIPIGVHYKRQKNSLSSKGLIEAFLRKPLEEFTFVELDSLRYGSHCYKLFSYYQ